MIKGKKILLCVSGSIAAYKSVTLLRKLITAGADVKIIMTKSAIDFISPLTFSTLSKQKVLIDLFDQESWANHALLGRWADVMIVAPASCHTIARMSAGLCDNLLLAVYLSSACPVMVAPAMDEDMWHHAATRRNIEALRQNGHIILPVNSGKLASGLSGEGRMAEPEEIFNYLEHFFSQELILRDKKVLVTAGPTYEALDPVRFIGNRSTGKMGVAIAEEFANRGADVQLILGPSEMKVAPNIAVERVTSAHEMYDACVKNFDVYDIIVMTAAVADYTPLHKSKEKIKKQEDKLELQLIKTKDILSKAGQLKSKKQIVVGFALETCHEKENALKKLSEKNADMIVLNSLNEKGAGFGYDTNKITIFDRNGTEYQFPIKSKKEVAADIVNTIIGYKNE